MRDQPKGKRFAPDPWLDFFPNNRGMRVVHGLRFAVIHPLVGGMRGRLIVHFCASLPGAAAMTGDFASFNGCV